MILIIRQDRLVATPVKDTVDFFAAPPKEGGLCPPYGCVRSDSASDMAMLWADLKASLMPAALTEAPSNVA